MLPSRRTTGPSESAAVSPLSSPSITRGVPLSSYSRRRSSFSSMSMLGGPIAADWPPDTALSAMIGPSNSRAALRFAVGQDVQEDPRARQRRARPRALPVGDVGLPQPRDGHAGRVGIVGDRRTVIRFRADRHHVVERRAEQAPGPDARDAFDVRLLPDDHTVAGRADRDLRRVELRRRAHADAMGRG